MYLMLFIFLSRHFGFYSFLREMFDAPDEVMSYLCKQYKVYDVPVGNDQTKAMIKEVHFIFAFIYSFLTEIRMLYYF